MNNIYLLKFKGGAGGDFLTYQISKDSNFFSNSLISVDHNNAWTITNPLEKFGIDLKSYDVSNPLAHYISKENYELIDKEFSDKHLIVRTHYTGSIKDIKLPRMISVNLTFNEQFTILFYGLVFVKRMGEKLVLNNLILKKFEECDSLSILNSKINYIRNRGYYYPFELNALSWKLPKSVISPIFSLKIYEQGRFHDNQCDHNLDVGQLYLNPKDHINKWAEIFQMNDLPNEKDIHNYFEKNREIFKNYFEKDFYDYKTIEEFLGKLVIYLKNKFPDSF